MDYYYVWYWTYKGEHMDGPHTLDKAREEAKAIRKLPSCTQVSIIKVEFIEE